MHLGIVFKVVSALMVAPVGWSTGWALADQTPPYTRTLGEVLPADPAECGSMTKLNLGKIAPGACVVIKWTIEVNEARMKKCDIVNTEHVSRTITDANGVHILPTSKNKYGGDTGNKIQNPLMRAFILPDWSNPDGAAVYWSEARFSCNWLQRLFPSQAVRINTPTAPYYVEASEKP